MYELNKIRARFRLDRVPNSNHAQLWNLSKTPWKVLGVEGECHTKRNTTTAHVHLLTDHSIYFCAQISILFPSTTRTWTDASSIDQSGVALQAHPEFATHVQVDWLRLESSYDRHTNLLIHIYSCRFVIRRAVVRKDLIQSLPLPRRLLDYLSYKNCYSELVESDSSQSPTSEVQPHLNSALSALFI